MRDSEWREKADQQSSDWIDTDGRDSEPLTDQVPMDDQALERIADLRLVDAILSSLSALTNTDQSERICRVMSAIPSSEWRSNGRQSGCVDPGAKPGNGPARRRRDKLVPWSTLIALAAGLLVAVGLSSVRLMQESRAETLLPKINEVAIQKIDRVYDMRRVRTSIEGTQDEIRGKLYLRGVEGFVITWGGAVVGRNANEYWFVPPNGKVIIANSFAWMIEGSQKQRQELGLLKELSVESSRVPLMQLSSVAQLMQYDYDVTVHSGVRHGLLSVDEFVGKRKRGNTELPDTIRLWSGAESRIIHGAQFVWGNDKEKSQANRLAFELIDAEVVPEGWYDHKTHHSADRPLRRVPVDL